jgi:hypothetical protein
MAVSGPLFFVNRAQLLHHYGRECQRFTPQDAMQEEKEKLIENNE